MSVIIDGFVNATIALALIYFFMTSLAAHRLLRLHYSSSRLNTRKLFVVSCFLTCLLRMMSFISISVLNIMKYRVVTSALEGKESDVQEPDMKTSQLFDKACIVLFDFPDFPCISAYMLLSVLWAEAIIQSRRSWVSRARYRRNWMIAYLAFNVILYLTQISLYLLLFVPAVDQRILTVVIYLTLTTINMGLPLLWLAVYLYLSFMFAGFPLSSEDAQLRLAALSRLGFIWAICRFLWGIIDLTSVLQHWMDTAMQSELSYSTILILIFLSTEVAPMALGLLSSSIQSLAEIDAEEGYDQPLRTYSHNSHYSHNQNHPLAPTAITTSFLNMRMTNYNSNSSIPIQVRSRDYSEDGLVYSSPCQSPTNDSFGLGVMKFIRQGWSSYRSEMVCSIDEDEETHSSRRSSIEGGSLFRDFWKPDSSEKRGWLSSFVGF